MWSIVSAPWLSGFITKRRPSASAASRIASYPTSGGISSSGRLSTIVLNPAALRAARSCVSIWGETANFSESGLISMATISGCGRNGVKPRVERGGDEHAQNHRSDEDEAADPAIAERRHGRARAEPDEPPAHAEQRRADHELAPDLGLRRCRELPSEGRLPAARDGPCDHHRDDRAAHDEGERRVPVSEEIEPALHLGRVGHPRDEQAHAEHAAGDESEESAHVRS